MGHIINRRWGGIEIDADVQRMTEVLSELDVEDPEHPDVSLVHESHWSISVSGNGRIVLENVETGEGPWHMVDVSRDQALALWRTLSNGDIQALQKAAWIEGYGS